MVRLAEQMGAMALVDELRHRHMQVDEHLDLPRRREEVAQRIRAYYSAQRIEVDDDLIEQGVRAYFAGRLEFQPPDSAAPEYAEALAYVHAQRRAGTAAVAASPSGEPGPGMSHGWGAHAGAGGNVPRAPVVGKPAAPSLAQRLAAFLGLRGDR